MVRTLLKFLIISVAYAAYLAPEQIAISWTENENEMRVTWKVYPMSLNTQLSYRLACNRTETDNWEFIKPETYVYKHGEFGSQYLIVCSAVIKHLQDSCEYEYKVSNAGIWSNTYKFNSRTPFYEYPFSLSNLKHQANLVILGDMGTGLKSLATRRLLEKNAKRGGMDGIFHLGDIGYNLHYDDGYLGSLYSNEIQEIATTVPYMTMPGNHEKLNNFTHYSNRFIMPRNWASQNSSYYYSLNIGRAHMIALSTEIFFYDKKPQIDRMMKWLEEDLITANQHRNEVPWIIAMAHKPLYCGIDTRYDINEKFFSNNDDCLTQTFITRKYLEEILYKYKIDLFIGAHVHDYERHAAIYMNMTFPSEIDTPNSHHNPRAPIHIIEGIAGNRQLREPLTETPHDWVRFMSLDYGYGVLKVLNTTHMYWEQINSETEEVIDTLMISKDEGYIY
jgi:hypothetical protein